MKILKAFFAAALLLPASGAVYAQTWPSKPIRWIVAFPPGGRKRMIENGYEPVGGEPEKLSELIRVEMAKWAKVVKAAGMKVD